MPRIPTFTTQARPTAEVGGVRSNVQAPIPTYVGKIQSALTDYYVKSEQASNITEAQKIKNSTIDKVSELTRISGNISNPRVASETFSKGYQEIINNTLSNVQNNNVKKLAQSSFLEDEYKFKYQVLNNSGKLLEQQTKSTLDETTTTEIATALSTGNVDLIKQLPTKLNNFYDKFNNVDPTMVASYKEALSKKINVGSFYNNLALDPSATYQSFDKGAYPELVGEERQKYKNIALSEITKQTTLLEKRLNFQSSRVFDSKFKNLFDGAFSQDDIINDADIKGIPVFSEKMLNLNNNIQAGKVTKVPDFDNVVDVTKKILNGEIKNLQQDFRSGFELTSKSILDRSDKFSKESYNTFAKIFQNIDNPEFIDQHKKFFNFIEKASVAVKSNPNFKNLDSEYNNRLDNFYNNMYNRFQTGIANKKDSNDLLNPKSPDYIGKDLYKFIPDSAEIMKGLYKGAVQEDIKSKTIPRLPGETPAQYKKRIGG
jgi:uncharacterized coiled-coil protein SlyX